MKSTGKLILFMLVFGIFLPDMVYAQCTNCLHTISSPEQVSSAIGDRAKATGYASFASGFYAIATGEKASSLGSYTNADGPFSLTLGSNASSITDHAMTIGHGYGSSQDDRLTNSQSHSLMVGFNSIYPTLFVSPSSERTQTGRVAIGNITDPETKLHIRADQGERASIFLEQTDFRISDIFLGNMNHGIRSTDDQGLIFRTEKNYIFNEGKIGLGTAYPQHELDVQGTTFTKEFILYDQEHYQESIEGWVMRANGEGNAYWTDPSLLSDDDWVVKDNNVYRNNGNIGIGTSSPIAQLDIADIFPAGGINLKIGNDAYFTDVDAAHTIGLYSMNDPECGALKLGNKGPSLFGKNNNLGIGTNNPSTTLELNKSLNAGGTLGICLANADADKWFIGMNGDQKSSHDMLIGNFENLYSGFNSFMVFKPTGNIGIGTNETHGYKLAVNGAIITEEVTVKVSENWPDFVFAENYEIPTLPNLKDFIQEHQHLPGIPSAKELCEEGLNVGQMEALLLQKIEELTLYIIEQDARILQMEGQMERLAH